MAVEEDLGASGSRLNDSRRFSRQYGSSLKLAPSLLATRTRDQIEQIAHLAKDEKMWSTRSMARYPVWDWEMKPPVAYCSSSSRTPRIQLVIQPAPLPSSAHSQAPAVDAMQPMQLAIIQPISVIFNDNLSMMGRWQWWERDHLPRPSSAEAWVHIDCKNDCR